MIATYDQLKSSIGGWLHRSDLAARSADLIALAEVRMNRNLRVRQMEKLATVTTSGEAIQLPQDWIELIGSPMAGSDALDFVTRDDYMRRAGTYGHFYSIIGSELVIGYQINEPIQIKYTYYAKIPALSDSNEENWLLLDAPDVYLYGALLESAPYLKNDERIETWRGLLQVAMTDLQASSDRAKYSGGTLIVGLGR